MSNATWSPRLRAAFSQIVIFFVYVYAISLSTSMAGMEIASVVIGAFVVFVCLMDRTCKKKKLELHTLGIEFPLLIFMLVVFAGLFINASHGDIISALGSLRLFVLLFFLTYSFQLVKNLNGIFLTLFVMAMLVACYAIWQHFTGQDLLHNSIIQQVTLDENQSVFPAIGFFSNRLNFAHSFMMIACLPWAAFLLSGKQEWWQRLLCLFSFCVIAAAVMFTYGRGAWIGLIVTLPVMAVFVSRKALISIVLVLGVGLGLMYKVNAPVHAKLVQIFSENTQRSEERRLLWEANLEMFKDHPWIGVGFKQNENLIAPYYQRLGITNGPIGHAQSNYIEFLATTGLLGFASYMLFILAFLLMTIRLLASVPSTHYWHKVFVLAALGAQVSFHVGGLTHWNFGEGVVLHLFLFWLAVIAYMSQRYYAHIVPDDRSI